MNLFETTIRVLGGLQSAFAMTPGGDRLLLLKVLSLPYTHSLPLTQPYCCSDFHR